MQDDMKELEVLLDYLIKHNKEHAEEITVLARKAKDLGSTAVHDDLVQGVEEMNKSNKSLEHALGNLVSENPKP